MYPTAMFFCNAQPYNSCWLLPQCYYNYPVNEIDPRDILNYRCSECEYYPNRFKSVSTTISKSELLLNNLMRMLWEQHIVWTRLAILSIISDSPDLDFVIKRLLRNPVDFENALKPFYGNKLAASFKDLLTNHLTIAADLVKAAKAGNNQAASDAEKKWYDNADKIAAFLSNINPYWSQEDWRRMLYRHLGLTKSEAVDLLTKNYEASISVYDEIEEQALEMADTMTKGIVRQFPYKFAK